MAGGTNTGDGTHGSYCKIELKVSQTEPVNPSDGLLWYKPDLCITTTTTTEPCDCETVMTVGNSEDIYGYIATDEIGTLNPNCEQIKSLYWFDGYYILGCKIYLYNNCCESISVIIDGDEYILQFDSIELGECVYMLSVDTNPFPPEGQTCTIRICQMECTTTTTTKLPQ